MIYAEGKFTNLKVFVVYYIDIDVTKKCVFIYLSFIAQNLLQTCYNEW